MSEREPIECRFPHGVLRLVQGNIVEQQVDAIVNAANSALVGGGGVDGAIHRAAGRELLAACVDLPVDRNGQRCPAGDVRVTDAFQLSAGWVIHGVGPVYEERRRETCHQVLRSVVRKALEAAVELGATSVAVPAISTGVYRFPLPDAARISIAEAANALEVDGPLREIRFVLFDARAFDAFATALSEHDQS